MTDIAGVAHGDQSRAVLLSASCRPLRRSLRPLAWLVLEEVALDVVEEQGRVVARTSARQIAQQLKIDPGTAASALRTLRDRGLIRTFREQGQAGRFGLAVYELVPVDGLRLVQPCMDGPHMASPAMVVPSTVGPAKDTPCAATSGSISTADDADRADASGRACRSQKAPSATSLQCPGQETLDFGTTAP